MSGTFDRTSFKTFKDLKLKKIEIYDVLMPYTEDAGLPYFDCAVVTANGYW